MLTDNVSGVGVPSEFESWLARGTLESMWNGFFISDLCICNAGPHSSVGTASSLIFYEEKKIYVKHLSNINN